MNTDMSVIDGMALLFVIGIPMVLMILAATRVVNCQFTCEPFFGKHVHEFFARRQGRRA